MGSMNRLIAKMKVKIAWIVVVLVLAGSTAVPARAVAGLECKALGSLFLVYLQLHLISHELNALKAEIHCLESEWRGGGYGHAIVRFIEEQGCDLAALGTRDRWNIRDTIFGSTAERIVRGAPCSILAVKPDPAL